MLDILASVILIGFALVFGLTVLGFVGQLNTAANDCSAGVYPGCNAGALTVTAYALLIVTVLAFCIALGMVIVRIIQKRVTFVWPLGGILLTLVSFYVATWVTGMALPIS